MFFFKKVRCHLSPMLYLNLCIFTEQWSHVSHAHFFYWLTCDVFFLFVFSFRVMNMPTNCQDADVFFINSCMLSLLGLIPWLVIANTMMYCWRLMKENRERALLQLFSSLHPCILQSAHPLYGHWCLESVPASQAPGQGHCGRMASPSQGTQRDTHSYIETI